MIQKCLSSFKHKEFYRILLLSPIINFQGKDMDALRLEGPQLPIALLSHNPSQLLKEKETSCQQKLKVYFLLPALLGEVGVQQQLPLWTGTNQSLWGGWVWMGKFPLVTCFKSGGKERC